MTISIGKFSGLVNQLILHAEFKISETLVISVTSEFFHFLTIR